MSDLRQSHEFRAYERVRDAVLRMKAQTAGGGVLDPSAYWSEELGNIDYMAEASPLIIRKLRHHAFHITGIRPYDYRTKEDGRREFFEARLHALRELGGHSLQIPEAPQLGGYGYDVGGRLFNVDTLKFNEVLVGMQRGGVLDELRRKEKEGQQRLTVCEIGAGWGGFAYQFKTLFPNTTYVIVDFAELFLFSATYLMSVFPEARVRFWGEPDDGPADFIFVPHTEAKAVSQLPLDLLVNMVSFQEMTQQQVEEYAAIAAAAGCPLLYSLNRERSPYNEQIDSVSSALSTRYRLTEVQVLDTDYTSAMKKPPKPGKVTAKSELGYHHYVGRLAAAGGGSGAGGGGGTRVVLGMTLYNNARHLRDALDSLLGQSYRDFVLVMLDDASRDETEVIAREYAARDPRLRYHRHAERQAMIATWHEAVEIAMREAPTASLFAWVSDHDRWHPRWLEAMVAQLDADPGAVIAYPITRRLTQEGEEIDKGPRLFDTAGCETLGERWSTLCREGVGSGDMVYGLMRIEALQKAGIFRRLLRPDRLLIAEMSLFGRIRQVPEVMWFRRQSNGTSIERQHHTLVLAGEEPRWFYTPPWFQHTLSLWNTYVTAPNPPLRLPRGQWVRMLLTYQLTYGWKHLRKSEGSHVIRKAISRTIFAWKVTKHHYHHFVYNLLVGAREKRARLRRASKRAVYNTLTTMHAAREQGGEQAVAAKKKTRHYFHHVIYKVSMLTHRLGLRGGSETGSR